MRCVGGRDDGRGPGAPDAADPRRGGQGGQERDRHGRRVQPGAPCTRWRTRARILCVSSPIHSLSPCSTIVSLLLPAFLPLLPLPFLHSILGPSVHSWAWRGSCRSLLTAHSCQLPWRGRFFYGRSTDTSTYALPPALLQCPPASLSLSLSLQRAAELNNVSSTSTLRILLTLAFHCM